MSLWLVRGGRHGEHEDHFFRTGRIFLAWGGELRGADITKAKTWEDIKAVVQRLFPAESQKRHSHTTGQWWAFVLGMKEGDWVVTPRKLKAAIAIGEVTGPCAYDANAEEFYHVYRPVRWLSTEVPRSTFDQDLLYSFGAFMTVCEIRRNDAEARVRALAQSGWVSAGRIESSAASKSPEEAANIAERNEAIDLERVARDGVVRLIERKYKGHGLARLVAAVLEAQGYTTHVSPPGADKGVDILAAPGALGFGSPRLCVQVKSGETPVDRPTLDQLIGAMQNFDAEQGLFVSWGGFKSSVDREVAPQFFRVRMWDAEDLVNHLLEHYERLPEGLRAELPLKRIWTIVDEEE